MSQVAYLPVGKREQTKVQNRQAILDAAREVFGELGYEAATVRDIIRRTGLAAGTFYNYYRSKEEVFAALADDGARRFAPILKALRSKGGPLEFFVRDAIVAYFEFMADEHISWAARRPAGEQQPHVHGETPEMAAVFAEVKDAIQAAIVEGRGPISDPDYMAAACIAVAREVCDRMLMRRPIDTAAAADFAVEMILNGLKGLPGARC
ncbi:MAG: TetR/AcrR family transcriptional regulator [Phenylobacterium sp.]|jgi:AcrR family transcriptional regulator|uniref:TetR/AcrR family transcriptional regulator n=1 Tax=unclassified Phenylobacterium TaxID=2640670 RepID=UPI0008D6E2DD|nr:MULTISPECIES: TetR/AcrR family transcriptional regulator [unclassified Phenylobacterium]MBJ7410917.1 TetR/AcrR family transcriptional regulator [Phenylobacterium sp.]OHB30571.1 MAG: TetR family transcriptional regulator [Phenylobacterium sp. RIFCSPHIGHO2_01_FULL_69_31]